MKRVLEPEVMDGAEEATSYASAAARRYLSRIDDSFVDHFFRLGVRSGRVLDVGTGPGVIPIKIGRLSTAFEIVGVDLSPAMLELARENLSREQSDLAVRFEIGDAAHLDFAADSFDVVISNSLLHHLDDPGPALDEMARVAKPDGPILIRDIRRPPGVLYSVWVRFFGRHYDGSMLTSYKNSLKAAFTYRELVAVMRNSTLDRCRVFRHALTHIGIVRPVRRDTELAGRGTRYGG